MRKECWLLSRVTCQAGLQQERPWIAPAAQIHPAAGAEPGVDLTNMTRRRPFIYVYDLPPAYHSRMLQVGFRSENLQTSLCQKPKPYRLLPPLECHAWRTRCGALDQNICAAAAVLRHADVAHCAFEQPRAEV